MITTQDKELLAKKGITEAQIAEQLACFQTGFPFLKLDAAASIEKGILAPDAEEQKAYLAAWDAYKNTDKTIVKFVPASGAASRMFKNLFEFLSAEYDKPTTKFEQAFFDGIRNFAFYDDLNVACQRTAGKDIPGLLEEGNYKAVVAALLETAGLNYGALPKGLLKFHKYPEGPRTPLEEHLAEGAMYAAGKSGKVNVHFTVSTEHRELFKKLVEEKTGEFAKRYGVDYYITFSEQKPSTDTIAADMDNQPFRDNGKLLFRPGGHGALIENLNDLDADIIFIKNIDNVVPDKLKGDTVLYKKLIAGVLVVLQQKAFAYLELLDSGRYTHEQVLEILQNNTLTDEIPCPNEAEFREHPLSLSLSGLFCETNFAYTFEEYTEHLQLTKAFAAEHASYSAVQARDNAFVNIQILMHENDFVMISKNTAPTIHFVIRHPVLRNALENLEFPVL